MEKIYTFKNATVCITEPDEGQRLRIKEATKIFLTRVIEEEVKNGNNNPTRVIGKK
jgi:hypothetical protein